MLSYRLIHHERVSNLSNINVWNPIAYIWSVMSLGLENDVISHRRVPVVQKKYVGENDGSGKACSSRKH